MGNLHDDGECLEQAYIKIAIILYLITRNTQLK